MISLQNQNQITTERTEERLFSFQLIKPMEHNVDVCADAFCIGFTDDYKTSLPVTIS